MPTTLSVTFRGLCLFAMRGAQRTDVLCLPEGGAHTPVLVAPVQDMRVAETTWRPTFVAHDITGAQIGIWDLRGHEIVLGRPEDQQFLPGPKAVRLRELHPTSATLDPDDTRKVVLPDRGAQGAILSLLGGTLGYAPPVNFNVRVEQSGSVTPPADYASAIRWTGQLTTQLKDGVGDVLSLHTDGRTIGLSVTNVATTYDAKGLDHFVEYYAVVTGVAESERAKLLSCTLFADVFDCVPPTDL